MEDNTKNAVQPNQSQPNQPPISQPPAIQPPTPYNLPTPPQQPQSVQPSYAPASPVITHESGNATAIIRKVIIVVALVIGAAAIVYGVSSTWKQLGTTQSIFTWEAPAAPTLSEARIKELEKTYGYDVTYRPEIAANEQLQRNINYDYTGCEQDACADAFALYSDAALTKKLPLETFPHFGSATHQATSVSFESGDMKASNQTKVDKNGDIVYPHGEKDAYISMKKERQWGGSEIYFFVQRLDEDGKKLQRPKVTVFTVKPDAPILPTPGVSASVDGNGAVNFSWNAVKQAKKYYVIKISREKKDGWVPHYAAIAQTDKTSLNLAEYNGDIKRAEKASNEKEVLPEVGSSLAMSAYVQNGHFAYMTEKTEDKYHADGATPLPPGGYDPAENGVPRVSFAVVAANGTAYSPIQELDGAALMAQIPVGIALNQLEAERTPIAQRPPLFEGLVQTIPVTMADGHTARKTALFDATKAVTLTKASGQMIRVPYRVAGTYLVDSDFIISGKGQTIDKKELQQKIDGINKRNIAALPPTGVAPVRPSTTQDNEKLKLDAKKSDTQETKTAATTMPTVPYPVNGSTPLVKYIAANLMAGKTSMDIRAYYDDPTITISEAISEAIDQNPYAQLADASIDSMRLRGTVLTFSYTGTAPNTLQKQREDLFGKAKAITAQIITPGMSDRQKALAINSWLVANASYDYDAYDAIKRSRVNSDFAHYYSSFPYAWNGLGTALYSKGVCASYAQAFKALADVAGVQAIYVTGTDNESGERHAWNKVFMDGKWQVVDVTWDDSDDGNITKYFGLTDAQANRVEADSFMVSRFIPSYAAN